MRYSVRWLVPSLTGSKVHQATYDDLAVANEHERDIAGFEGVEMLPMLISDADATKDSVEDSN